MRYLASLAILTACAAISWPQGFGNLFDKAPPHIDEALRARVTKFFQAHVDRKFRLADEVVHEDSKDTFFESEKTAFKRFKINSISYEDNFAKAKVVVEADMDFYFVGFGKMEVHRAVASTWKQDQGQWWWYVAPFNPETGASSPFGQMGKGQDPKTAGQPSDQLMALLDKQAIKVEDLRGSVTLDKKDVLLDSQAPSQQEILVLSKFPGPVTLTVHVPEMDGFSAGVEKSSIAPGESGKVIVSYKPPNKLWHVEMDARVEVQPLNLSLPFKIHFTLPPKK
jgi:hypothetical protein